MLKIIKNALWGLAAIVFITTFTPLLYDIMMDQDISVMITKLGNLGYTTWVNAGGDVTFTGDLLPNAADSYDVGSSAAEWNNVYVGSTGKIYLGTDQARYIDATHPATRGATLTVASATAPAWVKAQADYVVAGTGDDEIQAAINALSAGRTRKETVKVFGAISIDTAISVPSYTAIDLTEAAITVAAGQKINVFTTNNTTDVEIYGGEIDGNGNSLAAGAEILNGILVTGTAARHSFHDLVIHDIGETKTFGFGINIQTGGSGDNCSVYNITGYNCGSDAVAWKANYSTVANIIAHDNGKKDPGGTGLWIADCHDVVVTGVVAYSNGWGVDVDAFNANCYNIALSGITVYDNKDVTMSGIILKAGEGGAFTLSNVTLTNFTSYNNLGWGLLTYTAVPGLIKDITISNGAVFGNAIAAGDRGVKIDNSLNVAISNVNSSGNGYHGISVENASRNVTISNCVTMNNGQNHGNSLGIYISTNIASYTIVEGCIAGDNQGVHTQTWGIGEAGNADYDLIRNNTVFGNIGTPQILTAAAHTKIAGNIGHVTENSGTATVLNTTTSIVVNHGLATTPTRVQITPAENPTNAVSFWWVDTLTATQFTIHVNADPGASNLDFNWRAVIGEGN